MYTLWNFLYSNTEVRYEWSVSVSSVATITELSVAAFLETAQGVRSQHFLFIAATLKELFVLKRWNTPGLSKCAILCVSYMNHTGAGMISVLKAAAESFFVFVEWKIIISFQQAYNQKSWKCYHRWAYVIIGEHMLS